MRRAETRAAAQQTAAELAAACDRAPAVRAAADVAIDRLRETCAAADDLARAVATRRR